MPHRMESAVSRSAVLPSRTRGARVTENSGDNSPQSRFVRTSHLRVFLVNDDRYRCTRVEAALFLSRGLFATGDGRPPVRQWRR
jgi:penicillin V acylase-like amidase (Ntn superfamily)